MQGVCVLRTSGSASYWLCTPRITRRKPYTRSQKRCQCPWLVRGLTQQEALLRCHQFALVFSVRSEKKRGPTDRRTEIIQLHMPIRNIDFARALGFRSILGGGAVPRHQALVSCP